jgi:DNA-binding CsgD family transcriptional regulator
MTTAAEASSETPSREPRQSRDPAPRPIGSIWEFQQQIETFCRTAFDGLFLVDDERRYVRINQQGADLLGASIEQALASRIEDFTPPEQLDRLELLWSELARAGRLEGPYDVMRGDGFFTTVEFQASWNFLPGKHLIIARDTLPPTRLRLVGADASEGPRLSERECQVIQLAARGRTTREIAEALFLSPGTVKTHFQHIYKKLGVCDRASAVADCIRRGLIE